MMKKQISVLLQSGLLLTFGALIFHYQSSGKLIYFVYPFYDKFIVISAAILIALGIHGLFQFGDKHSHWKWKESWKLLVLIIPIVIGFTITPRPLSEQTALARGLSSDLSLVQGSIPTFGVKPEDRGIMEWVQLFNFNPEPAEYTGLPVHLDGLIVEEESLPENTFLISRFTLNCCAADARPIGIVVHYDPEAFTLPEGWIELKGEMIEMNIEDERRSVIELESFESIPVPINPYVY